MGLRTSSEARQNTREAFTQQLANEQAGPFPADQTNFASSTQETIFQDADLVNSDASEDEAPPPPYGKTYGEVRNEKDGLGASARVSEDGRVNIHINQLNRRLSQIFAPSLRQHAESARETQEPPPPYIPPSLASQGSAGAPPPPSLNVVIQVVGSRGDVQPFIALGKVLKNVHGHRVRLAMHPTFREFVLENGLEFFSIGGDPSKLMAFMVKNPGLIPGFRSLVDGDISERRRDVAEYIQGCWQSCYRADDGMAGAAANNPGSESTARPFVADCIIANPPSFAHIHCAEKLGIPLHIMFTMPYSPTQAFPHPLANIQSSDADSQLTNYVSYAMIELLSWQGLSDIINRFRARCLGLDPVSLVQGPGMLQRLKIPHTYCWSPALIPKPKDWGPQISISGYFTLASHYTPAPDLQEFLDAGPPPVYVGFGSIVLEDPDAMTKLIFEVVRKTGQRVLLSKGWGGMGDSEQCFGVPHGVFLLGNVPHDWLFKHVSCVVHHGGAGTTAAGISAGRPSVIIPFFGDQFYWGSMIARAGAGPQPIPHRQLTAEKLVESINYCLSNTEVLKCAEELGSQISQERGTDTGAQSFHHFLEPDRLRCTLAPSRAAVWRIRRTKIRLSAFAAYVLVDENLLGFKDLRPFRAREYETDEGPWDPLSGGFAAACGAFGGMAMGLVDLPSETVKAAQRPFRSRKTHSEVAATMAVGKGSFLDGGDEPSPTSLHRRSSTTYEHETAAHNGARPRRSDDSTPYPPTSKIVSTSTLNASPAEPGTEQHKPTRTRALSQNESKSLREYDMLRHTSLSSSSKGLARFTKTAFQGPMEISMGLTKGFRNLPKHWGDDTVRPAARINDFVSGAKAAGTGFGFGVYDGFTGLVTQPWQGARKEGVTGFLKGFGKGIGGFAVKPCEALCGVLGYTMKGVHKEVQKLLGSNVTDYIAGSRMAQGHDEWLRSSGAEKRDVVERWRLIQKYLKKPKAATEEVIQDVLDAHQTSPVEGLPFQSRTENPSPDSGSFFTPVASGSDSSREQSLWAADDLEEPIRQTFHQPFSGETRNSSNVRRESRETMSHPQQQRPTDAGGQTSTASLRQAPVSPGFEAESQSQRSDASTAAKPEKPKTVRRRPVSANRPPAHDAEHLAGATDRELGVQQGRRGEGTAPDKTEEELVRECVRGQRALEEYRRVNRRRNCAAVAREDLDADDDEDLARALELSLQERACERAEDHDADDKDLARALELSTQETLREKHRDD